MTADKFKGALLGTLVGDAFGLPFECAEQISSETIKERATTTGYWGYSDDSEMMIGLAESLLQQQGFKPERALQKLCFNYEPARGYGKGMKRVFQHLMQGGNWQQAAFSTWETGSKGNGAAARVAPVACLYHDHPQLTKHLQAAARITHAHPDAISATVLQGLSIAYLLQQHESETFSATTFISYLQENDTRQASIFSDKLHSIQSALNAAISDAEVVQTLGNGLLASESVACAWYFFLKYPHNLPEALTAAMIHGGDTDTIGAMIATLAGALQGSAAIPQLWLNNLEQGVKGQAYVEQLALQLFELYSKKMETGL